MAPSPIFGLQVPTAQKLLNAQSVSTVQPVLHAVVEAQIAELGHAPAVAVQRCLLSQALVVRVDPVHESAAQAVLGAVYRQAPAPSHFPSMPHGGAAVQVLCGSSPPVLTGRHCPVVFAAWPFSVAMQALQPVQAWWQHTPSARIPEAHSIVWAAGWPSDFCVVQTLAVASQ